MRTLAYLESEMSKSGWGCDVLMLACSRERGEQAGRGLRATVVSLFPSHSDIMNLARSPTVQATRSLARARMMPRWTRTVCIEKSRPTQLASGQW